MKNYYIFNNTSRASQYGIGTYTRQLTDILLRKSDIRVFHVDLYDDSKEFCMETDNRGIIHYKFPGDPSNIETEKYAEKVCGILCKYIEEQILLEKEKADVVCASSYAQLVPVSNSWNQGQVIFHFNYFQHYDIARILKARFVKSRVVLAIHYFNWCFQLNGNLTKFRKILKNNIKNSDEEDQIRKEFNFDRGFLRLSDYVIALSKFCERLLVQDYGIAHEKVLFIPNGLSEQVPEKDDSFRCCLNGECGKIVLYVGRLDKIKGLEYLLKAFSLVLKVHGDARLVIIGDGNYNECLQNCKGFWDRVTFTGKIAQEELVPFYRTSTLAVLPSFHEQSSYSAIEYMKYGLPFIGTDSTGLKEMLDIVPEMQVHINEESFSADDFVKQLSERINLLLGDKTYREKVSAIMKEQYARFYTQREMASRLYALIEKCSDVKIYPVSQQLLEDVDSKMTSIIHVQPDIETGFYGMAGIGVYLWWRVECLRGKTDEEARMYYLAEYLIYFLDWYADELAEEGVGLGSLEMVGALMEMKRLGFYRIKVMQLFSLLRIDESVKVGMPTEMEIVQNALKIFNTHI